VWESVTSPTVVLALSFVDTGCDTKELFCMYTVNGDSHSIDSMTMTVSSAYADIKPDSHRHQQQEQQSANSVSFTSPVQVM